MLKNRGGGYVRKQSCTCGYKRKVFREIGERKRDYKIGRNSLRAKKMKIYGY